jgi:hypothetical protein
MLAISIGLSSSAAIKLLVEFEKLSRPSLAWFAPPNGRSMQFQAAHLARMAQSSERS